MRTCAAVALRGVREGDDGAPDLDAALAVEDGYVFPEKGADIAALLRAHLT